MAPEVVSKLKYDGRAADIWAVGVLFVALLQGSFPFKGENERELFKKIRNNESKIVNQDKDVWKVLSKIFVVDPFQRATAKEVNLKYIISATLVRCLQKLIIILSIILIYKVDK